EQRGQRAQLRPLTQTQGVRRVGAAPRSHQTLAQDLLQVLELAVVDLQAEACSDIRPEALQIAALDHRRSEAARACQTPSGSTAAPRRTIMSWESSVASEWMAPPAASCKSGGRERASTVCTPSTATTGQATERPRGRRKSTRRSPEPPGAPTSAATSTTGVAAPRMTDAHRM